MIITSVYSQDFFIYLLEKVDIPPKHSYEAVAAFMRQGDIFMLNLTFDMFSLMKLMGHLFLKQGIDLLIILLVLVQWYTWTLWHWELLLCGTWIFLPLMIVQLMVWGLVFVIHFSVAGAVQPNSTSSKSVRHAVMDLNYQTCVVEYRVSDKVDQIVSLVITLATYHMSNLANTTLFLDIAIEQHARIFTVIVGKRTIVDDLAVLRDHLTICVGTDDYNDTTAQWLTPNWRLEAFGSTVYFLLSTFSNRSHEDMPYFKGGGM